MQNSAGFDLWAGNYDESVQLSDASDTYPFAGYRQVLGTIYSAIRRQQGTKILDLGFGTGVLSKRLYDDGYTIWGVDFSAKMVDIAKRKMPDATLLQHDFSLGLPQPLYGQMFDAIVCTYAIHHLDAPQKAALLNDCIAMLPPKGAIYIGDVAFETIRDMEDCRKESGNDWDEEEFYPVFEVLHPQFPTMEFRKISFCAGVLILTRP